MSLLISGPWVEPRVVRLFSLPKYQLTSQTANRLDFRAGLPSCIADVSEIDRQRVQEKHLLLVRFELTSSSLLRCIMLYTYHALTDCTTGSTNNTLTDHHNFHKRSCTIFGPSQYYHWGSCLADSMERETLNRRVVGLSRNTNSLRKEPSAWIFEQACHPALLMCQPLLVMQKTIHLNCSCPCTMTSYLNEIPITYEIDWINPLFLDKK